MAADPVVFVGVTRCDACGVLAAGRICLDCGNLKPGVGSSARAVRRPRARGAPIDSLALEYARVRRKLTHENYDYVTAVTGPEGFGKSTLAFWIALYSDPTFNGERIAFDAPGLMELLRDAPSGSAIVFDEAGKGLFAREFMSGDNRELAKAFMVARARNLHLVLCIPSFWDLDAYFRDHRTRAWALVNRRGEATFHVPSRNDYDRSKVFWLRVFTHKYGPMSGPAWETYDRRKMAFIRKALEDPKDAAEAEKEDAAGASRAMAEEVAVNAEFWTDKGSCRRSKVALKFGLTETKARFVANLAKELRG